MTAPTAAQRSCIITNCESAVFTLPAQENASWLGGWYHQLITAGPPTLDNTSPSKAPPPTSIAVRFADDVVAISLAMVRTVPALETGVRSEIEQKAGKTGRPE